MTPKMYKNICILVNEARYHHDPRVQQAGDAVGRWQRTLPEYAIAMRSAAKEMDELLSGCSVPNCLDDEFKDGFCELHYNEAPEA